MRVLRLWTMRAGAYGGFTAGIKGIAIEQMVAQYGSFDDVMNLLSEEGALEVKSPLDGSNLLRTVSPDVSGRVAGYSQEYRQSGLVISEPFGMQRWQETHPEGFNVMQRARKEVDPKTVFDKSKSQLRLSVNACRPNEKKAEEPSALVVPYVSHQDVFLNAKVPDDKTLREGIAKEFGDRWKKEGMSDYSSGKQPPIILSFSPRFPYSA